MPDLRLSKARAELPKDYQFPMAVDDSVGRVMELSKELMASMGLSPVNATIVQENGETVIVRIPPRFVKP